MAATADFEGQGYHLVLAEYSGYATRAGALSEQAMVLDANNLFYAVQAKYPSEPITLVEGSLGSGISVQVAGSRVKVLPAEFLVQKKFESFRHVQGYAGPV